MKRTCHTFLFLLFIGLVGLPSVLRAVEVSEETARRAVASWIGRKAERTKFGLPEKSVVRATAFRNAANKTLFHVVDLENGGYVVTSGDTKVSPIIAFSRAGTLSLNDGNPLAAILRTDMSNRLEQVATTQTPKMRLTTMASSSAPTNSSSASAASDVEKEVAASQAAWEDLLVSAPSVRLSSVATLTSSSDSSGGGSGGGVSVLPEPVFTKGNGVKPFITSNWSQGDRFGKHIFNYYTPNNYPCGCVVTAFAQCWRYAVRMWGYVIDGYTLGYKDNSEWWYSHFHDPAWADAFTPYSRAVWCNVDGVSTLLLTKGLYFDLAKMPFEITSSITDAQREEIGRLCYDLGVSSRCSYAAKGSSVSSFGVARESVIYGGRGALGMVAEENLPTKQLSAAMNNAIIMSVETKSPCVLSISGAGNGASDGHAVIVDGYGYQAEGLYLHLNCGWSGYDDLWYNVNGNGFTSYLYSRIDSVVYDYGMRFAWYDENDAYRYDENVSSGAAVGRVVTTDGDPVANAKVYFSSANPQWYTLTDDDGLYWVRPVDASEFHAVFGETSSLNTESFVANDTVRDDLYGQTVYANCRIPELVMKDPYKLYRNGSQELKIDAKGNATVTGTGTLTQFESAIRKCKTITINPGFTSICQRAFAECDRIERIAIPEGVRTIGAAAFAGCTGLKSVSFPSTLTLLHENMFYGCTALDEIDVADLASWCSISRTTANSDDNWNYYLSVGGEHVLYLTIPDGITRVSPRAFAGLCRGVGVITIPEGVTRIGERAFTKCFGLVRVSLPSTLESLSGNSFMDCLQLTGFEIADDSPYLTCIGGMVYSKDLTTLMVCPATKMTCSVLDGITTVSDYAFYGCQNMSAVALPSTVKKIGEYAFYGCRKLQEMLIPASVTRIEEGTFEGCASLESVLLPSGLELIGTCAFSGCTSLGKVEIPSSVSEIRQQAFCRCSSLPRVTIPTQMHELGFQAFYGCYALTNVCFAGSKPYFCSQPFGSINAKAVGTYCAYYDEWQTVLKDGKLDDLKMIYMPAMRGPGRSDDLDFETDGASDWIAQTKVSFDGREALRSGAIKDGEHTRVHAEANGLGRLSFKWRVSSEANRDNLEFWVDGTKIEAISGEIGDWRTVEFSVTNDGLHRFEWIYRKDASGTAGADMGLVDQVKWVPWIASDSVLYTTVEGGVAIELWCGDPQIVSLPATVSGETVVSVSRTALDPVRETMTSFSALRGVADIFDWNLLSDMPCLKAVRAVNSTVYMDGFDYIVNRLSPQDVRFVPFGMKNLSLTRSWPYSSAWSCVRLLDRVCAAHTNLTSVYLGTTLAHIGVESFFGCTGLTQLSIPASVTNIGERAFANCFSLTNITFEGGPPAIAFENSFPVQAHGYYRVADKVAWESVIVDGKWKGMPMSPKGRIHITYLPGSGGGGEIVEEIEFEEIRIKGVLFVREGFRQRGWSTIEGGECEYEFYHCLLSDSSVDLKLYPVWWRITSTPTGAFAHPVTQKTQDDFTDVKTLELGYETYSCGTSKEDGIAYYFVETPDQLENISAIVSEGNPCVNFILMNDINLCELENWAPIGDRYFAYGGIFDGNGHAILNLTVGWSQEGMGLFGHVEGASIENLGLENVSIQGYRVVGALVGEASNSLISNCYVMGGTVVGTINVGKLVGFNNGSRIVACFTELNQASGVTDVERRASTVSDDDASYVVTFDGNVEPQTFSIPESWFKSNAVDIASGVTTKLLMENGRNGIPRYESFLFGLDPESEKKAEEQFTATIDGFDENGLPKIRFSPDLREDARVNRLIRYTELGKSSLTGDDWTPVTEANRSEMHFFKVKVEVR